MIQDEEFPLELREDDLIREKERNGSHCTVHLDSLLATINQCTPILLVFPRREEAIR